MSQQNKMENINLAMQSHLNKNGMKVEASMPCDKRELLD